MYQNSPLALKLSSYPNVTGTRVDGRREVLHLQDWVWTRAEAGKNYEVPHVEKHKHKEM